MAITSGTIAPIQPASMHGGKSPRVLALNVASGETIVAGHVLIAATGKASVATGNIAANTLIGVAMEPKASIATAGDSDRVTIALATPGVIFIGSAVLSATDDYATPAFSDITGDATLHDIVNVTYGGSTNQFAAIDMDDTTTGCAAVIGFAVEQMRGKAFVSGASGTNNPRIYFTFSEANLFLG